MTQFSQLSDRTVIVTHSPMAGDIDRDPVDPVGEGVGLMA